MVTEIPKSTAISRSDTTDLIMKEHSKYKKSHETARIILMLSIE